MVHKSLFSEKVKSLKGISQDVGKFLSEENFSQEEINALLLFLDQNKRLANDSELSSPDIVNGIELLLQKEILIEKIIDKQKFYYLESIERFFSWIRSNTQEKIQNIENKSQAFIDLLRLSLGDTVQSEVTFFEGIEGIKDSYRHILDNAEEELCAYFSVVETIQPELQSFFENEYSIARSKKKIFSRNIVPKTPKTKYFKLKEEELFMEIKMVSTDYFPLINSEINLYGEYMHCMVFDEHGGFAVIIKGEIVKLQKALFEIAWKSCDLIDYSLQNKNIQKMSFWEHIYLTDDASFVLDKIKKRKDKYIPQMKVKWKEEKPHFVTTKEGESILKIFDLEVMSDFEKPYMYELAKNVTIHGGNILNVGFGLGLVDSFIEEKRTTREINEHHIIELNSGVFEQAKKWREQQKYKDKIFLHHGNWEDILPIFEKENKIFDGVVYDAYPLEIDEICRDSVPFLHSLLRMKLVKEESGIITFYLDSVDGIGSSFHKYLMGLGVGEIQTKKIEITLPERECEYWNTPFFLAPLLTNISYK